MVHTAATWYLRPAAATHPCQAGIAHLFPGFLVVLINLCHITIITTTNCGKNRYYIYHLNHLSVVMFKHSFWGTVIITIHPDHLSRQKHLGFTHLHSPFSPSLQPLAAIICFCGLDQTR